MTLIRRRANAGLIPCTHRFYDPVSGRWFTRDPIGYAGGQNLCGFADGNPVNESDPDGYDPHDPCHHAYYGPSGGYGWLRVYDNHKLIRVMKAANVTVDPDGNRNVKGNAPAPPGRYPLGPNTHIKKDGRPCLFIQIETRPGIRLHSMAPRRHFSWAPTEGCIRVQERDIHWLLNQGFNGKNAWIEIQDKRWAKGSLWRGRPAHRERAYLRVQHASN